MVDPIFSLTPAARARFHADLPVLLQAVRGRRRRRVALRGAVAALFVAAVAAVALSRGGAGPGPSNPRRGSTAAGSPFCAILHDDPGVVDRCTVVSTVRTAWLLDDDGLRELLRQAERPDGLVRVTDRVFVAAAAVDPFPVTSP